MGEDMKKISRLPLLIALMSLSVVSCNQEAFFEKSALLIENTPGEDIKNVCLEAETLLDCEQLSQICQPAYEGEGTSFYACVPLADPRIVEIEQPGSQPVSQPESEPVSQPESEPVISPDPTTQTPDRISVPDAIAIGCSNLHPKFTVQKGQGQPKVLVCKNAQRNPHNIVVACPSLKAHINQGDYVGACLQD
jgi:hypothetical protein